MLMNVAGQKKDESRPRLATLLKNTLQHKSFPVNFEKVLRTPVFHRTTPIVAPLSCKSQVK